MEEDSIFEPLEEAILCALGVVDYREHNLDFIGQVFGITRERVRQIEERTLRKLKVKFAKADLIPD